MEETPTTPKGNAPKTEVQLPPELLLALKEQQKKDAGCLRWGVLGCTGMAILAIVGLLLLSMKAKELVDQKLTEKADAVLMACEPSVSAADRQSFRSAVPGFVERIKSGKVPAQRVTDFRAAADAATADGKVTADELRKLLVSLE